MVTTASISARCFAARRGLALHHGEGLTKIGKSGRPADEESLGIGHAEPEAAEAVETEGSVGVRHVRDLGSVAVDRGPLLIDDRRDVYSDVGPETRPDLVAPDLAAEPGFLHREGGARRGRLMIAMVITGERTEDHIRPERVDHLGDLPRH